MCLINVKLDPAVTVKYRTAIKVLLLYFNLHLSVHLQPYPFLLMAYRGRCIFCMLFSLLLV